MLGFVKASKRGTTSLYSFSKLQHQQQHRFLTTRKTTNINQNNNIKIKINNGHHNQKTSFSSSQSIEQLLSNQSNLKNNNGIFDFIFKSSQTRNFSTSNSDNNNSNNHQLNNNTTSNNISNNSRQPIDPEQTTAILYEVTKEGKVQQVQPKKASSEEWFSRYPKYPGL